MKLALVGRICSLKMLSKARLSKKEREKKVLFGLIDAYILNPHPIGSKTLKENAFQSLSSATIRNYFALLEESGYLSQQHASGGRIPTEKAYQAYAKAYLESGTLDHQKDKELKTLSEVNGKEVGVYLQKAAALLSEVSGYPAFVSSPRFDQDSILDIKLVGIDQSRCLCIVITELGLIRTETLYLDGKLHLHALKRIEEALLSRLKGTELKSSLDRNEKQMAQKIYSEVMVRYIIGYANFSLEDIYKTGLSTLLAYPEFSNAESFASGLALFENENSLRELLKDTSSDQTLKTYIGSELQKYCPIAEDCSVLTLPYVINNKIVGVVGILGPLRMPYRSLFGILRAFSEYVSEALSQSIVKHKLSFRLPQDGQIYLESKSSSPQKLIQDQRE
jgi:heat-inducible transcriptional repressor